MKKNRTLVLLAMSMAAVAVHVNAQTADEVVSNYLNNSGGKDKWASVRTIRMEGKIRMQSVEIPVTILQGTDGKMKVSTWINGTEFVQSAYDGTTAWSTNAVTKRPEKMSDEDTYNIRQDASADFPDPFLNYKNKGYKVDVEGKEQVGNTEYVKVKLTKNPQKVNNKVRENSVFYYMDAQSYVPLKSFSTLIKGPVRGIAQEIEYADYRKVDGFLFPFEMRYRMNGQPGQTVLIEKITLNSALNEQEFSFPGTK